MMTISSDNPPPADSRRWPKWLRMAVSGVAGGIIGFASVKLLFLLMPDLPGPPDLGWPQIASIMAASISFVVGLILLAMSASRRLYEAENHSAEAGPEEHQRKAPTLRAAGIAVLAMAVEFGAFALTPVAANAAPVLAAISLSLAVQCWASWRIWQGSDELERAVTLEACALSLGAVFLLLSLWVPLSLYGFVVFDPLAVLVLATVAMVVPTIWLTARRGLTE
jgi:hypothetical protein